MKPSRGEPGSPHKLARHIVHPFDASSVTPSQYKGSEDAYVEQVKVLGDESGGDALRRRVHTMRPPHIEFLPHFPCRAGATIQL